MIAIVVIGLLLLVGLGLGLYFFVFAKKECKKITEEDECTEPCQWDTYGDKCIGEKDDLTPAPPTQPTPPTCSTYTTQDTCVSPCAWNSSTSKCGTSSSSPTPTSYDDISFVVPTKTIELADIDEDTTRAEAPLPECYMSRYADIRQAFKGRDVPLKGAAQHYKTYTTNGTENRNTTCYMTDNEAQCYIDRYPDVKVFAGNKQSKKLDRARKHYYEIGHGEGRDFTCGATTKELKCYFARYGDLQTAYTGGPSADPRDNTNWYGVMQHWYSTGKGAGRQLLCDDMPRNSQIGK